MCVCVCMCTFLDAAVMLINLRVFLINLCYICVLDNAT